MNALRRTILVATSVGLVSASVFLIVTILVVFMVKGEGSGPVVVDYVVALVHFPVDLLGLSRKGAAFPAAAFWGVIVGLMTFIALRTRDAFRQ